MIGNLLKIVMFKNRGQNPWQCGARHPLRCTVFRRNITARIQDAESETQSVRCFTEEGPRASEFTPSGEVFLDLTPRDFSVTEEAKRAVDPLLKPAGTASNWRIESSLRVACHQFSQKFHATISKNVELPDLKTAWPHY